MPYDTILRSSRSNDEPAPTNGRDRGAVEWRRSPHSSSVMRDTPPASEKLAGTDYLPQYDEPSLSTSDDGSSTGQDVEMSDHPRWAGRSRVGVLAALTLVGCVILALGVAAAYNFRNYYAMAAPSAGPDVAVDNTPNVTGPANAPQAPSKVIRDSFAANGWDLASNAPPLEWLTNSPLSSIAPPAAPPSGGGAAPSSTMSGEPKRVHTLAIRRDRNGQLMDVTSSTRAPDAAATRDSPGPLDPQQLDDALSAPPPTGGYVVQLATQRSEARAQASFRLMQAKYPSGFSGRSPIIKRSDIGAKGVFYRTLVGPFASAGDARQFCSSLKAAGGECIVQKN
jgi:cell division septation protein DedD